jgi:hypothetical protein
VFGPFADLGNRNLHSKPPARSDAGLASRAVRGMLDATDILFRAASLAGALAVVGAGVELAVRDDGRHWVDRLTGTRVLEVAQ